MADKIIEADSEGVYLGMSLEEFGVRVSAVRRPDTRGSSVMPRNQLRASVTHLQEELSAGEPLSPEDRARLESVLGEVSEFLASEGTEASGSESTFAELPTLVERFETTHPKLAAVLGRIADSLSQLGI